MKASPLVIWDWLEMHCFVQSFWETSCKDFSSIFRKEGRQKKGKKRKGRKERGAEGGSMGLTASHTGHVSS